MAIVMKQVDLCVKRAVFPVRIDGGRKKLALG
jgi:hypothetical protein